MGGIGRKGEYLVTSVIPSEVQRRCMPNITNAMRDCVRYDLHITTVAILREQVGISTEAYSGRTVISRRLAFNSASITDFRDVHFRYII
jgi:hypothetical protein